jgi:phosphoribosylformylglycinamidine synthase
VITFNLKQKITDLMANYNVNVIIENKPGINDPEGETILNDLVLKGKFSNVKKIRSAKMLKFSITERNKKSAELRVMKICDDLRIYNPLVSNVIVSVNQI